MIEVPGRWNVVGSSLEVSARDAGKQSRRWQDRSSAQALAALSTSTHRRHVMTVSYEKHQTFLLYIDSATTKQNKLTKDSFPSLDFFFDIVP